MVAERRSLTCSADVDGDDVDYCFLFLRRIFLFDDLIHDKILFSSLIVEDHRNYRQSLGVVVALGAHFSNGLVQA